MSEINVTSAMVIRNVFIESRPDDKLHIRCNRCYGPGATFYKGLDTNSVNEDWLATAITHLMAEHPEQMK